MTTAVRRFALLTLLGLLMPLLAPAQSENIETVEGARGQKMTLTARPHSLAEGLSARAMGVVTAMDSTRWALSLIGAAPDAEVSIRYGGETLPVKSVNPPADGGAGPVTVYVSQQTFLTMAETGSVTLTIGDVTTSLPEQLRREMQQIFERVS
ncbi:MAG: hypothetical protein ABEL97_01120 [Salinibacter sp.]